MPFETILMKSGKMFFGRRSYHSIYSQTGCGTDFCSFGKSKYIVVAWCTSVINLTSSVLS